MSNSPILSNLIEKISRRILIRRFAEDLIDAVLIAAVAVLLGQIAAKLLEKSIQWPFISASFFLLILVFVLLLQQLRGASRQDSQQLACQLLDKELAAKDRIISLHSLDRSDHTHQDLAAIRDFIDHQISALLDTKELQLSTLAPLRPPRWLLFRLLSALLISPLVILLAVETDDAPPITSTSEITLEQERLVDSLNSLIAGNTSLSEDLSYHLKELRDEIINDGLGSTKIEKVLDRLESTLAEAGSRERLQLAEAKSEKDRESQQETQTSQDHPLSDPTPDHQSGTKEDSDTREAQADGKTPPESDKDNDQEKEPESPPGEGTKDSKEQVRYKNQERSEGNRDSEDRSPTVPDDKKPEEDGPSDDSSSSEQKTAGAGTQGTAGQGAKELQLSSQEPKSAEKDEQDLSGHQGTNAQEKKSNKDEQSRENSSPDTTNPQPDTQSKAKAQAARARQLITDAEQLEEKDATDNQTGTEQPTKETGQDGAGDGPPQLADNKEVKQENETRSPEEGKDQLKDSVPPEATEEQRNKEKGANQKRGADTRERSESQKDQQEKATPAPGEAGQSTEAHRNDDPKPPPDGKESPNGTAKSPEGDITPGLGKGQEAAPIRGDEEQTSQFNEDADGDGGLVRQGLGFSDQELVTQPEQVDTRFTGSKTTSVEHNQPVRSKLGISKLEIKKPEITDSELQQPIPLEYKDKLK